MSGWLRRCWLGIASLLTFPVAALAGEDFAATFDALWSDMDRHYSYFSLKPEIDWKAMRERGREAASAAKSKPEFLEALKSLLGELKDMHIWIVDGDQTHGVYSKPFAVNWNIEAVRGTLDSWRQAGKLGAVGRVRDGGFGYVVLGELRTSGLDEQTLLAELAAMRDAPGFIVDLRVCAGGDEGIAQRTAAFFCAEPIVYAKQKYRSGAGHNEFTEPNERALRATKTPFTRPVVCLIGGHVMSSGEGAALMFDALPNVQTVGAPTRGASGNPQPFELPGLGIQVWYSRWVALNAAGDAFEGKGIAPDIAIETEAAAHEKDDPTFARGLEVLRKAVRSKE